MSTWRRILVGVVAVLAAALVMLSMCTRVEPEPEAVGPTLFEDVPTGAVLVDLDDGADSGDLARVGDVLAGAIAPARWPVGAAAFGEPLSEAARLYRVACPASEVGDVFRALADDPEVEGVEIERTWSVPERPAAVGVSEATAGRPAANAPRRFRPDDPYYKHQWHLDQIQMPLAWARTKGRGVTVAVIDTGVAYRDHGRFKRAPDLARTRFVDGWDFVAGDASPDDEHGHGTHVAGTIAQSTNNALGVAGVAPEAAIMPLRVLDRNGSGGWGAIAASIRWAADHGADVINMSLGGGSPSQTVRRAIDYAHAKGVVVVAAAGNAGRPRVEYPAAHQYVIAVGAVRFDETLAFYSSHGRGLDLVAPGGDLRVDQNGDGLPDGVLQNTMVRGDPSRYDYIAFQGTSMAAPHVAGAAALLRASGVRDPDAVERILEGSAKDLHNRRRYGAGLLQADAALSMASGGLGALRGLAALSVGLVLLLGLRRRRQLSVSIAGSAAVAFVVAGGLAMLPWWLLPGVGEPAALVFGGAPSVLATMGGAYLAPLVLSALIPFVTAAVLLGARRAGPVVVGVAFAFCGALVVEALVPTSLVAVIPSLLVGPWLLGNAVVAATIGWLAAKRG